jgi:hypothetical protein
MKEIAVIPVVVLITLLIVQRVRAESSAAAPRAFFGL